MASLKPLTPAEQSRVNYLKIRRAASKADAPPLTVHPDNAFLPDEPDDDINQIPLRLQGREFKCTASRPADADDPTGVPGFVELTFDGSRIPETRFNYVTPLDPGDIPLEYPTGYTNRPGRHELGAYYNQGGNEDSSIPLVVHVDRTPPHPLFPLIIPDEVKENGITKKYLEAHGSVAITIPEYADMRNLDYLEIKYGDSIPLAEVIATFTRLDVTTVIIVYLTAAQVIKAGEGLHALFFTITDRKGNISTTSQAVTFPVILTDPPEDLVPLSIPLFDDDGQVDLADAQTPLGAGIAVEYTNFEEGDELVVKYDDIQQLPQVISSFPCFVDIPFKDVFNGNEGVKTVAASYQIKRGSTLYPSTPISKDVDVDLRKPGEPIDPDNPGPINKNLTRVTVQGGNGGAPNKLTVDDRNKAVTVTVNIYTNAQENEQVQLRYNGKLVLEDEGGVITIPDTPTALEWTVEWSVFEAQGNGDPNHPMDYIIRHPLNDNVDISPARDVDVEFQVDSVPDPIFQNLDPDYTDWLNCPSLRRDPVQGVVVEVLVPGGEPALAEQELKFNYQGYVDEAGTSPKPNTDWEVTYTPTVQEATDGFIVKIEYEPIRVTQNAWGGVRYTALINGRPTPSRQHLVRVYMVNPGDGGTCRLPD